VEGEVPGEDQACHVLCLASRRSRGGSGAIIFCVRFGDLPPSPLRLLGVTGLKSGDTAHRDRQSSSMTGVGAATASSSGGAAAGDVQIAADKLSDQVQVGRFCLPGDIHLPLFLVSVVWRPRTPLG
jgi:hypothetical protein